MTMTESTLIRCQSEIPVIAKRFTEHGDVPRR